MWRRFNFMSFQLNRIIFLSCESRLEYFMRVLPGWSGYSWIFTACMVTFSVLKVGPQRFARSICLVTCRGYWKGVIPYARVSHLNLRYMKVRVSRVNPRYMKVRVFPFKFTLHVERVCKSISRVNSPLHESKSIPPCESPLHVDSVCKSIPVQVLPGLSAWWSVNLHCMYGHSFSTYPLISDLKVWAQRFARSICLVTCRG